MHCDIRVCKIGYAHASRGSTSRWMTEHHAPRRIKISGYPRPPGQPSAATVPPPCRPSHLLLPLSRVGIKSATHQPSGYLKSLSVDRLRYRRCFVRELVAFVARLHDPSLVVKYLRGKREKKWRGVCITERA